MLCLQDALVFELKTDQYEGHVRYFPQSDVLILMIPTGNNVRDRVLKGFINRHEMSWEYINLQCVFFLSRTLCMYPSSSRPPFRRAGMDSLHPALYCSCSSQQYFLRSRTYPASTHTILCQLKHSVIWQTNSAQVREYIQWGNRAKVYIKYLIMCSSYNPHHYEVGKVAPDLGTLS